MQRVKKKRTEICFFETGFIEIKDQKLLRNYGFCLSFSVTYPSAVCECGKAEQTSAEILHSLMMRVRKMLKSHWGYYFRVWNDVSQERLVSARHHRMWCVSFGVI